MPFTPAPAFASAHDGMIASIETAMAPAPISHQPRGHTNSAVAVTVKSSAAASQSTP